MTMMMTIAVTAVNYSKIVLKFYSGDLGWNLYQKVLNRIYEALEEQNHRSMGSSDSQYFLPSFPRRNCTENFIPNDILLLRFPQNSIVITKELMERKTTKAL